MDGVGGQKRRLSDTKGQKRREGNEEGQREVSESHRDKWAGNSFHKQVKHESFNAEIVVGVPERNLGAEVENH